MKKNIIIVFLLVLVLSLGGYLIYDKLVLEDGTKIVAEETNNSDLILVKELVDKYYGLSTTHTSNIFNQGLTTELKMIMAFNSMRFDSTRTSQTFSCDELYGNTYSGENGTYIITEAAVCEESTYGISYDEINYYYKKIFNQDMPKQAFRYGLDLYDYVNEYYIYLNCNCSAFYYSVNYYEIKNVKIINNKLVVEVKYFEFTYDVEKKEFVADFDNTLTFDSMGGFDNADTEDFKELMNKHYDKIKTSKMTFYLKDDKYMLEDCTKASI